MAEASRRGSMHTVQGFCVSMLPQILQTSIFSIAACKAVDSGAIKASRFLTKNSAARRAERGPSPGRRASNWIKRSISGPAAMAGIVVVLQPSISMGYLSESDETYPMPSHQFAVAICIAILFPMLVHHG